MFTKSLLWGRSFCNYFLIINLVILIESGKWIVKAGHEIGLSYSIIKKGKKIKITGAQLCVEESQRHLWFKMASNTPLPQWITIRILRPGLHYTMRKLVHRMWDSNTTFYRNSNESLFCAFIAHLFQVLLAEGICFANSSKLVIIKYYIYL